MNGLTLKTKIVSGENSSHDYDYSCYSRVLIVTDQIMNKIGLCDIITSRLNEQKIKYYIFDEVEPNPSFETVTKGVAELIEFNPDAIIALGGGSVIDAAKGFIFYGKEVHKEINKEFIKPALIAIPTTSGAGSEVTAYAVITDTKNHIKIPLVSDIIIPDVAILDSLMTKSCPPKVSAESGIDVLTHVLESYVATDSNVFTEALSEKVCKMVFQELINVFKDGNNMKARLIMHEASCMAGVAFTNSGLGLNHAMSHILGGKFPIPHGRANALLMPQIIKINQRNSANKYAKIAALLGFPSSTDEEGVISLLVGVEYLCNAVQLERSVTEFGISKETYLAAIPEMAKAAHVDPCINTNPVKPTIQEIEEIYKAIL